LIPLSPSKSCSRTLQVEEEVAKDVSVLESTLEADLRSFGRGFTVLESSIVKEFRKEEGVLVREVGEVSGSPALSLAPAWLPPRALLAGAGSRAAAS
jgi:hypothetical protein